jgi:indolepyruvate ferredoxin oxidoreductase
MGLVPLTEAAILRAIELNKAQVAGNTRAFALGRWSVVAQADAAKVIAAQVIEKPKTLAEKIAFREQHLTAYQSARLAKRYRKLVDSVQDPRLREAVALGYHKLLAYKDEFEVARLHLQTMGKARAEFDGDFTPRFHLAPPLLSRMGSDGRPRKRAFGPAMLKGFAILAKLKALRGTPLDPFGYTAERRMERALIRDYERLIPQLVAGLTPANHAIAVELAELPLTIRGFGPVKHRNAEAAAKRRAELLAAFDKPPVQMAAE